MTLPAHMAGGYLALRLANKINPKLGLSTPLVFAIGLGAALLPDIDAFSSVYLKDHHSFTHAPLFWVLIFISLCLVGHILSSSFIKNIALVILIGSCVHLFLDWFSGRTAGLQIFYPFSFKQYSLFPLNPEKGKIPISIIPSKDYLKFYAENGFLLFVEISIIVGAVFHFVVSKLKSLTE